MIGRLRGNVVSALADGACVIDVNGVGYEVFVPLGTLGRLPQGQEIATLHVHTHVREDQITLYGFASAEDRAAFRTLLSVSSVGPKIALAILSQLAAHELARAVAREDVAAFKGISGVGKKIAERLVLELRDKLTFLGAPEVAPNVIAKKGAGTNDGPLATVTATLVQMGFKLAEAERAVALLEDRAEGKPVEVLLREALASLA